MRLLTSALASLSVALGALLAPVPTAQAAPPAADGYTVISFTAGSIARHRTRIPVRLVYRCPRGEQVTPQVLASHVRWSSPGFPDRVIDGLFFVGFETVTCTGRRQLFSARYTAPTAQLQFPAYFLPSPAVLLTATVGPTVVERVVSVR